MWRNKDYYGQKVIYVERWIRFPQRNEIPQFQISNAWRRISCVCFSVFSWTAKQDGNAFNALQCHVKLFNLKILKAYFNCLQIEQLEQEQ